MSDLLGILMSMKTKKNQIGSGQTIFMDLQAKRSPEEVGGWAMVSKMGFGMAATLEMPSGVLRIFEEKQLEDLVQLLNQAECVIGYFCVKFDFPLLRGVVGIKLRPSPSLRVKIADPV